VQIREFSQLLLAQLDSFAPLADCIAQQLAMSQNGQHEPDTESGTGKMLYSL
jgi:hypothetical protein